MGCKDETQIWSDFCLQFLLKNHYLKWIKEDSPKINFSRGGARVKSPLSKLLVCLGRFRCLNKSQNFCWSRGLGRLYKSRFNRETESIIQEICNNLAKVTRHSLILFLMFYMAIHHLNLIHPLTLISRLKNKKNTVIIMKIYPLF